MQEMMEKTTKSSSKTYMSTNFWRFSLSTRIRARILAQRNQTTSTIEHITKQITENYATMYARCWTWLCIEARCVCESNCLWLCYVLMAAIYFVHYALHCTIPFDTVFFLSLVSTTFGLRLVFSCCSFIACQGVQFIRNNSFFSIPISFH